MLDHTANPYAPLLSKAEALGLAVLGIAFIAVVALAY